MHLLLIDIGNTRLKWAVQAGQAFVQQGAMEHGGKDPVDYLNEAWRGLTVQQVICASVAHQDIALAVQRWLNRELGCAITLLQSPSEGFGIRNAYQNAAQLGCDRWAGMVAARMSEREGLIAVLNCGTATTLDVVAADGQHLGGMIIPGMKMMITELQRHTAQVRLEHDEREAKPMAFLGRDTEACIYAGGRSAVAGIVMSVEEYYREQGPIHWFLTGGATASIRDVLPATMIYRPDLVLEGLAIIAANNN